MRRHAADMTHNQPGNPVKLAEAMIALVDAQTPPLRLPPGTDTLQAVAEKNACVGQETETWKALSSSTDFPARYPALNRSRPSLSDHSNGSVSRMCSAKAVIRWAGRSRSNLRVMPMVGKGGSAGSPLSMQRSAATAVCVTTATACPERTRAVRPARLLLA